MPQTAALERLTSDRDAALRHRTRRKDWRPELGRRLRAVLRRGRSSLTVGLIGLGVMLAVVPITYYDQQRQNEGKYGSMLRLWADNETRLAARALAPILDTPGATPFRVVQDQLSTLTGAGRQMYLMFRPANGGEDSFYVVASAPQVSLNGLETEWREWEDTTSWPSFGALCAAGGSEAIAQRGPDAVPDTVRAAVSIPTTRGCWVLVTAYDSQYMNSVIGGPQRSWIGIGGVAAAFYLAAIGLAAFIWLRSWRGVTHFGRVAREISENGAQAQPFARHNKVPELAHVATDFDRLVTALHGSIENLRRNAEDNAHALKTPLATIRHSLQPIKRSITTENDRAKRAVDLIEQSIGRLETLVGSAQPAKAEGAAIQGLDAQGVESGDRSRRPVDLSRALANVLLYYRKLLAARNLVVVERLHPGVTVVAAPGAIEAIVNNVIDNAISFSPLGGEIAIELAKIDGGCELSIEDSGPGVDPACIERIFDRYISLRSEQPSSELRASPLENVHSGLGLWIVRRNVEALGGTVVAANRRGGGLCMRIALPTAS